MPLLPRPVSRFAPPVAAALLAVGLGLAACGTDGPATPTDPVLAKGEQIHRGRCAACHGVRGQGGTGRKLNNGAVTKELPDVADHTRIVREGIPGSAMAAWKDVLTPDEIDAVVRYQREVIAKLPD